MVSGRKKHRQLSGFFRYIWHLLFVATMLAAVGVSSARLAVEAGILINLKEELRLLESDNRRLEAEVARLQSLDLIEREARVRLGMVKPERINPVPLQSAPVAVASTEPVANRPEGGKGVVIALSPPGPRGEKGYVEAGAFAGALAGIRGLSGTQGIGEAGRKGGSLLDRLEEIAFSWLSGK